MDINSEQLKKIIKEAIKEAIAETKPQTIKLTLTLDECAEFTGIGRNKLTELVYKQNTDFPYFKVGSKFLINKPMLIKWLEKISEEGRVL